MNKWRFIDSGFGDPDYNMALDEALFESFLPEVSKPLFRLYRWRRPAISLGRFQTADKVLDIPKCRRDNLAVVKRITAGSALYHSVDELTYSLVCPAQFFKTKSIKESYREITDFIIKAYQSLGFLAQYAKDSRQDREAFRRRHDFCFSGIEEYDILIKGRKIGGNAQKRKREVIFQHGSIPVKLLADIEKYFLRKENKRKGYISLSALNFTDIDRLKKAVVKSFTDNLGIELLPDTLTQKEQKLLSEFK